VGSPPPVSVQLAAPVDVQLMVYACPIWTVDAELDTLAVGAGLEFHVQSVRFEIQLMVT
jgi:hypothetical protein